MGGSPPFGVGGAACESVTCAWRFSSSPRTTDRTDVSHVEAEQQHVAVVHDVILALLPHHALLLHPLPATVRDEVGVARRLGLDEAALEVGVDDPRRLRRGVAAVNGPGAHLLFAGREVGLEPE